LNSSHTLGANNKTKAMWQVIKRKTGNSANNTKNIQIKWGSDKIKQHKNVAELFSSYFVETPQKLVEKIISIPHKRQIQQH
jgi:hypothetical protein